MERGHRKLERPLGALGFLNVPSYIWSGQSLPQVLRTNEELPAMIAAAGKEVGNGPSLEYAGVLTDVPARSCVKLSRKVLRLALLLCICFTAFAQRCP